MSIKNNLHVGYMEQLRLPANHESLPLHAHLCLMLRVRFLLREQIEVGRHDDVRSLVRSGKMPQTIMNHKGANCHRKAGQCCDSFISIILSVDHIECIMTLTEIKLFFISDESLYVLDDLVGKFRLIRGTWLL